MTKTGNFEWFQYFNLSTLKSTFNTFKTSEHRFANESTKNENTAIENHVQKPMFRQTKWRVQNGAITKGNVSYFFGNFVSVWQPFFLFWCTIHQNFHIHTFLKHWSLLQGAFFQLVSLRWSHKFFSLYLCHYLSSDAYFLVFLLSTHSTICVIDIL